MEEGTVVAPLVKAVTENISVLQYVIFFTVTACLFVGVFLLGKYVLPKFTKARKIVEKPK